MEFEEIPDDLDVEGLGAPFKEMFAEYLRLNFPNRNPDDEWRWLWHTFDLAHPDDSDIELTLRIVD